jgi:hypothetical protein
MAEPTFVTDYEGASWDTTANKTTGAFTASAGDVLVAPMGEENDAGDENYTWTNTGGSQTWTEHAETTGVSNADTLAQAASTVVSGGGISSGTVTCTKTTGVTGRFNVLVAHFSGSDGIGATARSTGAGAGTPALAITTTQADSAIVYLAVDWNATDVMTSRTHRTVNGYTPTAGNGQELTAFRNSAAYSVIAGYIPNAGASGSNVTVGISAPTGGDWQIVAVEVLGTAGAPPTQDEGTKHVSAMMAMTGGRF